MIKAHHYHNDVKDQNSGAEYVRGTLLKELREKDDLKLADVDDKGNQVLISTKQLGIELPVMITSTTNWNTVTVTDPNAVAGAAQPAPGPAEADATNGGNAGAVRQTTQTVGDYPFVVEFIWKPTPLSERQRIRQAEQQKKAAEPEQPKVAAAPDPKTATP